VGAYDRLLMFDPGYLTVPIAENRRGPRTALQVFQFARPERQHNIKHIKNIMREEICEI
ncbi:MAG: hypothetical protein H6R26_858, partial [Proteobacteria bacterium]|nr:hypothetical protein [Pseudomonadota bacterium]